MHMLRLRLLVDYRTEPIVEKRFRILAHISNQLRKHVKKQLSRLDKDRVYQALKKEYGIEVIAGEDEKPVLENPSINLTTMIGTAKSYSADRYVKDGEEVELGKMKFKVIFTPGHTCGSVCYICGDTMISGDTLFMGSCGRTDFPTGDWKQMTESLKLLKNLDGDYKVYSGHGPSTTLERERKTNMYMR